MSDLRNLPAPVLERLSSLDERDLRNAGVALRNGTGDIVEARSHRITEIRQEDNGDWVIDGYATVYDFPYDVAGGPPYGWTETIVGGAARKSVIERDDVRAYYNHDGMVVARTKSGTLTLESDDVGLRSELRLSPKMPTVQDLVGAMERNDLDEMSFAFRALRQEWNDDYTERRIIELKLYDVSVVDFPANPATVAQLRSDAAGEEPPAGRSLSLARAQAAALSI